MQEELTFNLYDLLRIGLKYKKQIVVFTAAVTLVVAAFAFVTKNKYQSYANFYPSNAMIATRDHLFRDINQDAIDVFGFEREQDKIMTIGNSAPIISYLVYKYNMFERYGYDTTKDVRAKQKTFKKFDKRFSVGKGSYSNCELTFIDENAQLASDVANSGLQAINDGFKDYFVSSQMKLANALQAQTKKQDSIITKLTDTLILLREKYNIFDIISPSRKADIALRSNNAEGIEVIQTIEEQKDKYVVDRARYQSLADEFKTIDYKDIPFLQVIQYATPAGEKHGPFRTLMVLGALAATFVVGLLLAFISEMYQNHKHKFIS